MDYDMKMNENNVKFEKLISEMNILGESSPN